MQIKLILGLVLSVAVATGAFAQSGSKANSGSQSRPSNTGSQSRSYSSNTNAMAKKEARMLAKEEGKLARQIAKAEFGKVKLTKDQKDTLAGLVHDHMAELKQYDMQIKSAIPAGKTKDLAKAYRMATKEGQSKADAMATSMMKAGINEMVQKKVLGFNESKAEVMTMIRETVMETFDEKQMKTMADAKAMMMKEKAGKEMKDKADMKVTENAR